MGIILAPAEEGLSGEENVRSQWRVGGASREWEEPVEAGEHYELRRKPRRQITHTVQLVGVGKGQLGSSHTSSMLAVPFLST